MDTSLNFVALIETNPITRLNREYNNKFINKIKETFTETQQQLFVSSLYCFLNYHPTNDYVIDLDNIWRWLGFSQKIRAKELLEKHFIIEKDYKILLSHGREQDFDKHGGHNKQNILLNVQTFKLLCIKADTKKSHEIHEYFIKLEELMQTIVQEESNELKLQLEQVNQQMIQTQQHTQKQIQLERQKVLLSQFNSNMNIIYILRVKQYENGEYVIKIGESRRGIEGRFNEHKNKYEDPLLLDCFAVKKCKDFERYLHTHDNIRMHKVTDLVGHESEQELFRIGRGFTYQSLQKIIHQNIQRFNEMDEKYFEDMILHALSNLNLQNTFTPQNDLMQQILQNQQQMLHQLQSLEKSHKELHTKYNTLQTRTTTNFQQPLVTLGPRLQKINPETMTIDNVYESVSECLNESLNTKQRLARPSIDKAITENTIYHGFRWAYVSRDKDPNIIHNLPPTKQTKIQNIGYIAKVNQEKTEIIQVYIDRKTAATMNGYASNSALDTPVKKQTLTNGFYYMLYDQCDETLKQAYEEQHGEPLLYRDGVGQYDQEHQLLRTFIHKYDCMKQLKISDKTLAKALDKPITYNQCYYKMVGSKLVC
uniref:MSV199 domain-containing protein n=1 Tax=viral metagenome TaxID=1070528 RepID=A0A6C0HV43_9ZZZZ